GDRGRSIRRCARSFPVAARFARRGGTGGARHPQHVRADCGAHPPGAAHAGRAVRDVGFGSLVASALVRNAQPVSARARAGAVTLATGGARGITAEVCLDLAVRYQPTFVLVGQSPLPPATESPDVANLTAAADLKRALIARLQTGGARVTPAMVEKAYRHLL